MEIGMEALDDRVTKGTFGEDEQRPARFGMVPARARLLGVMSDRLGMAQDGSGLVGVGSEKVRMFQSITVSPL